MDTEMEDTIVVRGPIEDTIVVRGTIEDAIIVRGSTEVQVQNNDREIEVAQKPVALTEEDYGRIQEIILNIDLLKNQASSNDAWRKDAEADYLLTRNRVKEMETISASAVATATEAGRVASFQEQKIITLENHAAEKESEINKLQAEVFAAQAALRTAEGLIHQLWDRIHLIEGKLSNVEKEHGMLEDLVLKKVNAIVDDVERGLAKKIRKAKNDVHELIRQECSELQQPSLEEMNLRWPQVETSRVLDGLKSENQESRHEELQSSPTSEHNNLTGLEESIYCLPTPPSPKRPLREPQVLTQGNPPPNAPKGPKRWLEWKLRQSKSSRKGRLRSRNTGNSYRFSTDDTDTERERTQTSRSGPERKSTPQIQSIRNREKLLSDEIKKLKERINQAESRYKWETVRGKQKNSPRKVEEGDKIASWSKTSTGRHKLVITAADDGSVRSLADLQEIIESNRKNKTLLSQIGTIGNFAYEYKDRKMLHHNHRGGIRLSVETPQEAIKLINLSLWIKDRKHRIQYFQKAQADDQCKHCSSWGHLERSCLYGGNGRCSICSKDHRTENHSSGKDKKRKEKTKCPNCNGNHTAMEDSCPAKQKALEKQLSREQDKKPKGDRKKVMQRGARSTRGHSRRND